MIQQIEFNKAITLSKRKNSNFDCYLEGHNLNKLPENNALCKHIKENGVVAFEKVNAIIHSLFQDIDYIDFWTGIKIYRVVYY